MTTRNTAYGTYTALTVTNLQSMASDSTDPYTFWQSQIVDNRSTLAIDYEIRVHLPMAATAPSGDAAVYLYLIPWMYDGSSFQPCGNFGTTTQPTGTEGQTSNGLSDPNSLIMGRPMPYKVTSQIVNGYYTLSELLRGMSIPEGWSLAIRNATGAALSTGCLIDYRAITETYA